LSHKYSVVVNQAMIGGMIKQVLWYSLSAKWNDASILHIWENVDSHI
jgi:hypothetical protein